MRKFFKKTLKWCFLFITCLSLHNCNSSIKHDKSTQSEKTHLQKHNDSLPLKRGVVARSSDTSKVDYFKECTEMESWIGSIQGVRKSVKLKSYGFKSCNKGKTSFDLIFDLKNQFGESELSSRFEDVERNNYEDFIIFAFEIPMKKDYDETNEHDDPNIYPSFVKAYKYSNGKWFFVKSKQIKSLNEYGEFQSEVVLEH